jgi:hypothetical protein
MIDPNPADSPTGRTGVTGYPGIARSIPCAATSAIMRFSRITQERGCCEWKATETSQLCAAFPHTAPPSGNDGSTTRMQSNDWYTYPGAGSDARVALDCIPLGPPATVSAVEVDRPLMTADPPERDRLHDRLERSSARSCSR